MIGTSRSPLEALADELGAVAARIEREARLQIAAGLAEMRQELANIRTQAAECELRAINAERALAAAISERLATIRDGEPGQPGRDGIDGRDGEVGPPGQDGRSGIDGQAGRDGKDGADGSDGAPGRDGLDGAPGEPGPSGADGTPGLDGAPGRDGADGAPGRDGVPGQDGSPGRDGIDGKEGEPGAPGRDGRDGADGARGPEGPAGRDGVDGQDGERGPEGPPGKLPVAEEWRDGVHYEGDVVTIQGATYQSLRDTAREPPHEDWRCLAAAGKDGRSFVVCGTWDGSEQYRALDVVALNGASFVARRDDPGLCPGDGWQLIAAQGKRGTPGERGAPGPKGDIGPAGPPVMAINIDRDGLLTLTNGDGSIVACDFYPILSRIER